MTARAVSDVAIIGAGITGLSTAFQLAELRGQSVVIYERAGIGAEASGVQPGGVRQQWSTRVSCLLARESFLFYRDLPTQLEGDNHPVLESCGYLFVAHTVATLAHFEQNVALQRELGVPSSIVSPQEAGELVPALDPDAVLGGAFCPEDGYFDRPQSVVEAFADAARRHGVAFEHAEVVSLDRNGAGWTLRLADGRKEYAAQVVVAAGYASPALLEPLGLEVPITKEARHLFFSEPISQRLLDALVISPDMSFASKQLANGRLLASDLSARGEPSSGEGQWRGRVRRCITQLVPLLEFVSLPLLITGYYDMTPDHQPIVGPIPAHEGLWIAAGFSGHGFMIAPAIGRALAAGLSGDALDDRLAPLAWDRFDGTDPLSVETQVV
jgi:sarcosine oxidase, subunit beta